MMSEPLVSIIVPVFNNEKYIGECVDSLLKQTYGNLQIILVDDGSEDSTYSICQSCKDERILVLRKENGGASSARNAGLRYAEGEYIYFVDSDDSVEPHAVERLVSVIREYQADCVFYEANNYTEEAELQIRKDGLKQKTDYAPQAGSSLIPLLLKNKDYHAAPFLYFMHRSVLNDLTFEEGIMFEDELFTFLMLKRCRKVVSLREILYHRRMRRGSVMTSEGKGLFRFHSISVVLERLTEMYEENSGDAVLNQYTARIGLLWFGYWRALSGDEKKQKQDDYDTFRQKILRHKGFGSRELIVRCYGYYPWIAYIFPGRVVRRLQRRRLK